MNRNITVDRDTLQELVDFLSSRWDDLNQRQRFALDDARTAITQQTLQQSQEIPGQQSLF